jgi:hypothetical protein
VHTVTTVPDWAQLKVDGVPYRAQISTTHVAWEFTTRKTESKADKKIFFTRVAFGDF